MAAPAFVLPEGCLERAHQLLAVGRRQILGIAAAPGAGKSTLAQELAGALGSQAVVVPMDGFHLANAELKRLDRAQRKGAPDTFDAAGYLNLLHRLHAQQAHETVYAPAYDRNIEESVAGAIAIDATTTLVITEGNYLLLDDGAWSGVRGALDAAWYLDIDDALRESRLMERHVRFGRSAADARSWIEKTDAPNARQVALSATRADWSVKLG
jgi:pantothenate kinase